MWEEGKTYEILVWKSHETDLDKERDNIKIHLKEGVVRNRNSVWLYWRTSVLTVINFRVP